MVFCDSEGNGIDEAGNKVSIGTEPYFEELRFSESSFLYIKRDDDEAQRSILVAERVDRGAGSFMVLYYPVEKFDSLLSEADLAAGAFLALVDSEGRVLSSSGSESRLLSGGNLLEAVQSADSEEAGGIRDAVTGGRQGTGSVRMDGESRILYYAPLDKNQWGIILGIPQSHVEKLIGAQWKNTKGMLISLIVVFLVFSCFTMVIDIIGRIRDNQQKKELENKADTDLLTVLGPQWFWIPAVPDTDSRSPPGGCCFSLSDVWAYPRLPNFHWR